MKRRCYLLLCVAILVLCSAAVCYAATDTETNCADALYELGLFSGTGKNADGSPVYSLEKMPTRAEAITMLVRLLGKESEAQAKTWETPFKDVPTWAEPYVGYAYNNGLTNGVTTTAFGSAATATETQYLSFILRALGYSSDENGDFKWNEAKLLTNKLGITSGDVNKNFLRGNIAEISYNALAATKKNSTESLIDSLYKNGAVSTNVIPELGDESVDSQSTQITAYIISENPAEFDPEGDNLQFEINGHVYSIFENYLAKAGTYTFTVLRYGSKYTDYEVLDYYGTGLDVTKNPDGTFTAVYDGKSDVSVTFTYDEKIITTTDADGKTTSYPSRMKASFEFCSENPAEGIYLRWHNIHILNGKGFGANLATVLVANVYYNDKQITDYTVEASSGAPFTASVQADGSLLIQKNRSGKGSITVNYGGETAVFNVML